MILNFTTGGNTDVIDITREVESELNKKKIKRGLVNLFVKGSTAAITVIEPDKNLYKDLREVLEKIIPMDKDWAHHQTWGDRNGASHLRASIIGPDLTVPIVNGVLYLGTWQKIVLIDFDTSSRQREVCVTFYKSQ